MFDFVRNNKKVIQIVLAIIFLPFALWGVESYIRDAGTDKDVATVGGSKISVGEFQRALREEQERLRPMLGGRVDPALLESPELRRNVVDTLVNQRLLAVHAQKAHLWVSDAQLSQFIATVPALQEDGKFSKQRYEAFVAAQGLSAEMFEARLRQDLVMQQAIQAVTAGVMPGKGPAERWLAAQLEEREIAEVVLRPEQYQGRVRIGSDAVKAYYEANRRQFETPEQVKVEFLALSQEKLVDQVALSDKELQAAFEARKERYREAEQRRASHILVMAAKNASDGDVKAAQSKAEEALAQLKKAPGDFAKLAKQYSQDPGSADKGGDLGWFGRGMMVKPFEDAVFGLKEGQTSDIVRSEFGFHIIKLTGVRAERVKAFEEVRDEIGAELKREAATKKYLEAAEAFSNMVYEQADSLQPAAEKFKLTIQKSDWIARSGAAVPPFTNAKLLGALFADDAIKNKRNTEAIEVSPNVLVAARVVEHKPAALQALEAVQPTIEKILARQEAGKLAAQDGAEKLARLQKGEAVELGWLSPRKVTRVHAPQLAKEAVAAVFKADVAKTPAYVGTELPGGAYALYRIGAVKPYQPGAEEAPAAKALRQQYERVVAEEEFMAWVDALKARHEVTINKALIEAKDK